MQKQNILQKMAYTFVYVNFFSYLCAQIYCARICENACVRMRNGNMDKRNEEIFEHILQSPQADTYWGRDVSKWLTPVDVAAIYFDFKANCCYLLHPNNDKNQQLQIVMELLSYLDYAIDNHILYAVTENNIPAGEYLLYDGVMNMQQSAMMDAYNIGEGKLLRKNFKDGICIVKAESPDEVVLSATDISFLFDRLCYYCFSHISATKELDKFIKHDYLSPQDFYSNRAICISVISIIVAVLIACVSPIIGVKVSNEWGKATLKECQYKRLVDEIQSSKNTLIIQRDTTIVHDTIYLDKKSIKPVKP